MAEPPYIKERLVAGVIIFLIMLVVYGIINLFS